MNSFQKIQKYYNDKQERIAIQDANQNQYEDLFRCLGNVIVKQELKVEYRDQIECCCNQMLITDKSAGFIICENCGIAFDDSIEYIDMFDKDDVD